jgi:hypothetical protein
VIYLLPHPKLLDWSPALHDPAGAGLFETKNRLERLGGLLRLVGNRVHSAWLPDDRFKLVLTRPLVDRFWDERRRLLGSPAAGVLRNAVKAVSEALNRKLSHLLIADQERFEHEDNLECSIEPSVDDESGDLVFALACIARAFDACSDPEGAKSCLLLIPSNDLDSALTLRGPGVAATSFRLAADPALLGELRGAVKGLQFPTTLTLPCEAAPDWKEADVSRSDHERALKRLIKNSGGSKRAGKGDHKVYSVQVTDYLPWRGAVDRLCLTSRCARVERGANFNVSLTVDRGKKTMRPSYATSPGAKAGLPPAIAWRLLFQGDRTRPAPALVDLLSGSS